MIEFSEYTKMMLIADVHYGIKSGGDNTINYLSWMDTIDTYFRSMIIPTARELVEKKELPFLVVCGDFFDNRISLRVDVMNRAVSIIKEVSSYIPVVLMAGNHDSFLSETAEVNSLQVFEGIPNVYIVSEHDVIEYNASNPVTVDLFPWIGDRTTLGIMLKNSTTDIALIHADINGMRYASNTIITDGVETKGYKGKRLYSGHIHKRQETKKVTYIGSPYEMDRSDMGNVKGIYVVGKSSGGKLTESFIENTISPRFVNLSYAEFVQCVNDNTEKISNNYVEITYGKDDKIEVAKIQNDPLSFPCKDLNFKYVDDEIVLEDVTIEESNANVIDTIEEYIRSIKDITPEQRKFLLDKNREYIEKVSNK